MMVLTLHNLAHNYHLLPSEILSRGTTFDLYVLDTHTRWMRKQDENESKKHNSLAPRPNKLSIEQMKAMIDNVRARQQGAKQDVSKI